MKLSSRFSASAALVCVIISAGILGYAIFNQSPSPVASVSSRTQTAQVGGSSCNGACQIFLTSGSTWTVPSNWNSSNNTVEAIGGGGGGKTGSFGGAGGGGGAYSKASDVALTPGATVGVQVGSGGGPGANGGDTYLCNSASNCASLSGSAVVAGAQGGTGFGTGGSASSGVGGVTYSGGAGGTSNWASGGGGGGAAGPDGPGQAGGSVSDPQTSTWYGGGGGGGNGGGSSTAGGSASQPCTGGAGGTSENGTAGGSAYTGTCYFGSTNGGAGSNGSGGGGGSVALDEHSTDSGSGGTGGNGIEWGSSGSGGGGGGSAETPGNGGLYGGGGGQSGYFSVGVTGSSGTAVGGSGAPGIIVITYTPAGGGSSGSGSSGNPGGSQSSPGSVPPSLSSDIYMSQSGVGSGSSCSSALSVTWFNVSSNWGNGSNQIGPGDTVHLCGNITTPLVFQGGGSPGSPVTLKFEPGASMTLPSWSLVVSAPSAVINLNGQSYITIDGGATGLIGGPNGNPSLVNGVISNTDSGVNLDYGYGILGIAGIGSNNITIENLAIENLYVAKADNEGDQNNSSDIEAASNGAGNPSNWVVNNMYMHDSYVGFAIYYGPGTQNMTFSNSTVFNTNWGGNAADTEADDTIANLNVSDDYFHDFGNWDERSYAYHHNGFYLWNNYGGRSTGVVTFNGNLVTDYGAQQTAGLFLTNSGATGLAGTYNYFNNIFDDTVNNVSPGTAEIYAQPAQGATVNMFNNTIVGNGYGNGLAAGASSAVADEFRLNIRNNIITGKTAISGIYICCGYGPVDLSTSNNLYYNFSSGGDFSWSNNGSAAYCDYSSSGAFPCWFINDADSPKANPNFVPGTYIPQSGSPAAGLGVNLSSSFSNDYAGNNRPSSGPWEIGAYQYCAGGCSAPSQPVVQQPSSPSSPSPSSPPPAPEGAGSGGGAGGGISAPVTLSFAAISVSASQTSATISWTTSLPASGQVRYGLTSAYGSQSALLSTSTAQSATLADLSPDTLYHYSLIATDAAPDQTMSADYTFTTAQAGAQAPLTTVPTLPTPSTSCPAGYTCTTASPAFIPLMPGATSATVKLLQEALNAAGYAVAISGPGSKGDETTYFGPATETALKRYQCILLSHCSGSSYGILDQTTAASLHIATAAAQSASAAYVFTRTLAVGSTGADVAALQGFLNSHGFTVSPSGPGSPGHETDYYGPATAAAVTRFQDAHASAILAPYGLTQGTGFFGTATMREVNSLAS